MGKKLNNELAMLIDDYGIIGEDFSSRGAVPLEYVQHHAELIRELAKDLTTRPEHSYETLMRIVSHTFCMVDGIIGDDDRCPYVVKRGAMIHITDTKSHLELQLHEQPEEN